MEMTLEAGNDDDTDTRATTARSSFGEEDDGHVERGEHANLYSHGETEVRSTLYSDAMSRVYRAGNRLFP
jgi:hypothetical protein